LAVALPPHHALVDQVLAHGGHGRHFDAQCRGDLAGAVRSWSKLSHRPEVFLFEGREAVEPNAAELGVETGDNTTNVFSR
jgi:hypothetical protein